MTYLIEPYEAADGWRWRMVAPNGEIVADGAQAYSTESNLRRAIMALSAANFAIRDE